MLTKQPPSGIITLVLSERTTAQSQGRKEYGGIAQLGAQGKQSRTPNQKTKYVLFKHRNPYGGIAQLGAQGKQSRTPDQKTKYVLFKYSNPYGGIAQLGERLNGIQEVSGSIPLISTKSA